MNTSGSTGLAIIDALARARPGARCRRRSSRRTARFTWGASAAQAVEHAAALEEIAHVAFNAVLLDASVEPIGNALLTRHFCRKHGPTAYYGQR